MAKSNMTVSVEAMDLALNTQCCALYQVMGIVELASRVLQGYGSPLANTSRQHDIEIAWAALDGAHTLLDRVTDKLQTSEALLAKEVSHGED